MARVSLVGGILLLVFTHVTSFAAEFDLEKTRAQFLAGKYDAVIKEARGALKARLREEDWHLLLAKALWMKGGVSESKGSDRDGGAFELLQRADAVAGLSHLPQRGGPGRSATIAG